MQVFFSWSGQTGYRVAMLLRELVHTFFLDSELTVPKEDIEAGERWSADLFHILDQSDLGVVFLDPASLLSYWLHFEVGALAKSVGRDRIKVILFGLQTEKLTGPFSQYQAFHLEKDSVLKFLEFIRTHLDRFPMSSMELRANLDLHWSGFEKKLAKIDAEVAPQTDLPAQPAVFTADDTGVVPIEYLDDVDEKILALLCVNNGLEEDRVANRVYLGRGECLKHLIALEKRNFIWSSLEYGIRRWYITDLGKKYLPGIYQG